jgi:hypothetical protein
MSSPVRQALSVILLASVAAVGAGCNQDTASGGAQGLVVTITPNPAGAGRYELPQFIINKIQVLPVDPELAALYGTEKLLLRFKPYTVDLAATQDITYSTIALSAGTYRVTFLEVTPPSLVDSDLSPTPASCIEGLAVINAQSVTPNIPDFSFADPPSLNFTVQPGQTRLAIKINIPGLISSYESAFTCVLGCGPGGTPCLTAFDQAAFRAAILANLTLE